MASAQSPFTATAIPNSTWALASDRLSADTAGTPRSRATAAKTRTRRTIGFGWIFEKERWSHYRPRREVQQALSPRAFRSQIAYQRLRGTETDSLCGDCHQGDSPDVGVGDTGCGVSG